MKKYLIFALAFALFSCAGNDIIITERIPDYAQTKSLDSLASYSIETPFSFDEIHSEENWMRFHTLEEKFAACELPDETLSKMSTSALLQTCINHPLARLFFAYDNHLLAIDVFYDHCNTFREFVKRSDAVQTILETYVNLIIKPHFKGINETDKGYEISTINECFLELVMGSGYLEKMFVDNTIPVLSAKVSERLVEKLSDTLTYSYFSTESTLLLSEAISYGAVDIYNREKARRIYESLYDKFVCTPETKAWYLLGFTTLNTTFGKSVQGRYYSELSSIDYQDAIDETLSFDPNANIISPPTSTYNCHSYAWNICDGGETSQIWPYTNSGEINLEKYWTQDYYGVVSQSYAEKAVYGDMEHSAIRYSSSLWESKWGVGPLVRHSLTQVPYTTSPISFYGQVVHIVSLGTPAVGVVGTPVVCSPSWLASVSNTSCSWYVTNQHGDETGYSQAPSGTMNAITFTQPGSYDISCDVYWNSVKVGQGNDQIIVTY